MLAPLVVHGFMTLIGRLSAEAAAIRGMKTISIPMPPRCVPNPAELSLPGHWAWRNVSQRRLKTSGILRSDQAASWHRTIDV